MAQQSEQTSEEHHSSLFLRFKQGLGKTRGRITEGFGNLVLGQKEISDELLEKVETSLLLADLGTSTTDDVMKAMIGKTSRQELNNAQALVESLRNNLTAQLQKAERQLTPNTDKKPFVLLVVGVNGAGKTTTIGKLGRLFSAQGLSVILAAGDTFRAAANEQLQVWGKRINAPVVSQQPGADPAAVIFDAMESARARHIDIVLADTAGRLQNKKHLMAELEKIQRVMGKFDSEAPHEVLLVLDGAVGRNGLKQAQEFCSTVAVSGLVITKLDGTAQGGFIAEASKQTGIPICYVGIGEQADDLQPFLASAFVDALLADLSERL